MAVRDAHTRSFTRCGGERLMARYRSRFDPVTAPWQRQNDHPHHIGRHRAYDPMSAEARRRVDRARALVVLDEAVEAAGGRAEWSPVHDLRADVILSAGRRVA